MKILDLDQLDLNKTYSYADYLKWQFDERIELIKGKIFKMSPAPATRHQQYVGEIFRQISNHLHRNTCKVFVAPFDVRLTPSQKTDSTKIHTVVQPDICVVCDPSKIDAKGCIGAPDLIIEVLSPGNTQKEMNEKFEIYRENGVKEYWLVEPNDRIVLVYVLDESGKYIGLKPFTESETLTSQSLDSFKLLVKEIFEV
ncbi:Uma2 family endonuclease [Dyadobacter sp. Leaf189]|uniref:Uma2 family endonuclease n=1 Tax=Dyadobacter sp. Leaf189 TaxID=1736295 RepID=UPI0006FD05CE|nr:Uma2 family endonuclease [Dyadobacter sp. Leaf189]KQS33164.1 restriction endonuclease [Dyadobacter sp. Leaf189]